MDKEEHGLSRLKPVLVWDLPTRLFHWLLVALVASSVLTAKLGGNFMVYHVWSGEVILGLLLFRIAWGFVGSTPSRFRAFVAGPATVIPYALTMIRRDTPTHIGHNPLGGWSVLAMLLALLIQAGTGLFANDDIATTGPLYKWVSKAGSDWITSIHHLNKNIVIALVGIHVAAVLFHLIHKRDNLITPMITGEKQWRGDVGEDTSQRSIWLAAVIAALAAAAVYVLVR